MGSVHREMLYGSSPDTPASRGWTVRTWELGLLLIEAVVQDMTPDLAAQAQTMLPLYKHDTARAEDACASRVSCTAPCRVPAT